MEEGKVVEFIEYASGLSGYEKGEAHLFLDRLFIAYGNKGVIEAGAALEKQIVVDMRTKFCDLLWPHIVLFEMKARGEKLADHFQQAKIYWDNTYGNRPKYVILCNFDEFWIYDWNVQREPLDKVPLKQLKERWKALAFLCPEPVKPIFGNNLVEVTEEAADKIAQLYNSLVKRKIDHVKARRFSLQCLVCLFAEDSGMFPDSTLFTSLIEDCLNGQSTYDLFQGLFKQMNNQEVASGGKYKGVKYFNGGIFSTVYPIELNPDELQILKEASVSDWSKVQPSIFGTIFEDSLGKEERHVTGAHYTLLSEIMSVVEPTILRPWRERIEGAKTLKELYQIHDEMGKFIVLDPACGSGNFLYVAYREFRALEIHLLKKIVTEYSVSLHSLHSKIKCNQFYGIDLNPLGIELAKITLAMAKKITIEEFNKFTKIDRLFEVEDPLPFDNLDDNFIQKDALLIPWPLANAIIGNPPYQSKNKMQDEYSPEYVEHLHEVFPEMPGRADYCVYWFRKAHDLLPANGRAGLVGTNTIRETYSRIGGLDYIVSNGGVICDAISTMPWSGSAAVHVSIVNWIKSPTDSVGKKKLRRLLGEKKKGVWEEWELDVIPPTLSADFDVTKALVLKANLEPRFCYQGQTQGHEGFLLTPEERETLVSEEPMAKEITFPFLIAEELIGDQDSLPKRYVIDFQPRETLPDVMRYPKTFKIIQERVLPKMIENAQQETEEFKVTKRKVKARQLHLEKWWLLWRGRGDLMKKIASIDRYVACGQVTKRPIFEFVSSEIHPNAALIAFPLQDDYSYGILQSSFHWAWFKARCSTLTERFRYTTETVFDSYPWPQWGIDIEYHDPSSPEPFSRCVSIAQEIAVAGRDLRKIRNELRLEHNWSFRELYRTLEMPGNNPLRDAHERLDKAVLKAYTYPKSKMYKKTQELKLLFELNQKCGALEKEGKKIFGPGLPTFCEGEEGFTSDDCVHMPSSSP